MASQKKLTETEFEELKPHLGQMKARSIDIARAAIVQGAKQADLAAQYGITNKAVSQMVGAVWKAFLEHGSRPDGWVTLNVALPPEMAVVVKQMEKAAVEAEKDRKK